MWLGKVAVIMYIFSLGLMFAGYYLDLAFEENNFTGATFEALDELATKNNVDEEISIELIFGDFIAGVRVLFGILTGDTISQAFHLLPGFVEEWDLLVRIIFTLSSAFLWIFVVTGRSV